MSVRSKPLTTGEVARYCHVTVNGVKKWISENKLRAFQLPGGHYRIEKEDFREFLVKHNIPVEPEFFSEWKKKILIADDEATIFQMLKTHLLADNSDFLIEYANDGYDALMKVGDFKPDLLILDLMMPRVDGYEVCRRLKDNPQTSHIKVIVMTGQSVEATWEHFESTGISALQFKPLDIEEMRILVYRTLGLPRPRARVATGELIAAN